MKKFFLAIFIAIIAIACEKEPIPTNDNVKLEVVVDNITKISAKASLTIEARSFEIISQGVCYSKDFNLTLKDKKVSGYGVLNLVDLEPNTKYYIKGFVVIGEQTFYSGQKEFDTEDLIISLSISGVTKRSATATFQADANLPGVIETGVCFSKDNEVPSISDRKMIGVNTLKLDLLGYETRYFVRAYVETALTTYYSQVKTLTTTKLETVQDYDGNSYRVIEIMSDTGPTFWLLDNFKGTHFANGDPIPLITDNQAWTEQAGLPARCHYDNDPQNTETYGALYNWYVGVDPRGLIPGWKVPTDKEWTEMINTFSINNYVNAPNGRFKEEGSTHWKDTSSESKNESGFTALPAGYRSASRGDFDYLHRSTYFACMDSYGDHVRCRALIPTGAYFQWLGLDFLNGLSIRLRKM